MRAFKIVHIYMELHWYLCFARRHAHAALCFKRQLGHHQLLCPQASSSHVDVCFKETEETCKNFDRLLFVISANQEVFLR